MSPITSQLVRALRRALPHIPACTKTSCGCDYCAVLDAIRLAEGPSKSVAAALAEANASLDTATSRAQRASDRAQAALATSDRLVQTLREQREAREAREARGHNKEQP